MSGCHLNEDFRGISCADPSYENNLFKKHIEGRENNGQLSFFSKLMM